MQPAEPTLAALSNPVQRYFLATRPLFLSVTLFACLIGLGTAQANGVAIVWPTAFATIVFALLAHAGVNVLNDYYDALNGSDAINTERVFPYTGGSRFIQNSVLTLEQTARFGVTLFAVVMIAGVWLTTVSGAGLLVIGLAGTGLGLLLGLAIAHNLDPIVASVEWVFGFKAFPQDVYLLDKLPSRVLWPDVLAISVTSVLISLLATILPSRQAAAVDPVVAIRYE